MMFGLECLSYSDLLQTIGLLVSASIPLLVLFVTNHVQGKRHKESMSQQNTQFAEQIETTKANYKKQIQQQSEATRVTYMPFLHLDDEAEFGIRNDRLTIRLRFENLGNGTAFETRVVCCNDVMTELLRVCNAATTQGEIPCRYTAPFSDNVIPIRNKASFELILDRKAPFDNEESCGRFFGELNFKVRFLDAFQNEYHQSFFFQFSEESAIRTESRMPELQDPIA